MSVYARSSGDISLHHTQRTILLPDFDHVSQEEGMARVALRDAGDGRGVDLHRDRELIEAIASLFEDMPTGSRFARVKRVRRDRLHAMLFLVRHVTKTPPRVLVKQLDLPPRYLRFALERGRRLVEQAKHDGRIRQALEQLRHAGGG
jgi:hypothetical protein